MTGIVEQGEGVSPQAGSGCQPSASAASSTASSQSGIPNAARVLSTAAWCIAGGWFGAMRPGHGELTFSLVESKPQRWAAEALRELCAAGFLKVRELNSHGGLVFTPLLDCRWALKWMVRGGDKSPEAKLPLTEPLKSRQDGQKFQRTFLASVDTLPKGQDAKQGLAGTEGSAVANGETPTPSSAQPGDA